MLFNEEIHPSFDPVEQLDADCRSLYYESVKLAARLRINGANYDSMDLYEKAIIDKLLQGKNSPAIDSVSKISYIALKTLDIRKCISNTTQAQSLPLDIDDLTNTLQQKMSVTKEEIQLYQLLFNPPAENFRTILEQIATTGY